MIFENDKQLQDSLEEWQKILRLQDWIVQAKVVRARDMILDESAAAVSWTYSKRMASIQLLDPLDYTSELMEEQDHEISLVHELLHLHYAGFETTSRGTVEHALMEQSIEATSRALVYLKRKVKVDG